MSPEIEISLDAEGTLSLLAGLPPAIRRRAIINALKESSRFVRRRLMAATRSRTGRTHRALRGSGSPRVEERGDTFETRIKRPRIFNLLESGATPHEIRPGRSKQRRARGSPPFNPAYALRFGGRFAARVQHPGFVGRKVFAPVAEAAQADVAQIFRVHVSRTLQRMRARAARAAR